jgi:hypothetical protein
LRVSGQLSERGCTPATSGQVDVVRHLSILLATGFHVTVPHLNASGYEFPKLGNDGFLGFNSCNIYVLGGDVC